MSEFKTEATITGVRSFTADREAAPSALSPRTMIFPTKISLDADSVTLVSEDVDRVSGMRFRVRITISAPKIDITGDGLVTYEPLPEDVPV